jgi:hypothetical protein
LAQGCGSIFGGRNHVGNNKPMQECREQGRDSTRRREGSGFDGRRLRVVDTPISSPSELASDPPARDRSRAPDCAGIVSRLIARRGRGRAGTNQENPSAAGSAAAKLFQVLAGRTLKRYAISSMLFVAMFAAFAENGFGANLVSPTKTGSFAAVGQQAQPGSTRLFQVLERS